MVEFTNPLQQWMQKYSKSIDDACEAIHPRIITSAYLESANGTPRYCDLSNEITEELSVANWDFLDRPRSRLRAIHFLLAIGGLGKDPDKYVRYAAIPELIHNGTLIHDDIEDGAQTRRNDVALHLKYGVDTAVNSANLLYFSPLLLLSSENDISQETRLKAVKTTVNHLNRVTWGQGIDILWHKKDKEISLEKYLQMCCYKTGALDRLTYSLAGTLAESDATTQSKLEQFGETVGIGLQIHDDVLDVCRSDRRSFGGKPVGNDITEGKKSLVNVLALKLLPQQESKRLSDILHLQTRDPKLIQEALTLIYESEAIDKALCHGVRYFSELSTDARRLFCGEPSDVLSEFFTNMKRDLEENYAPRK